MKQVLILLLFIVCFSSIEAKSGLRYQSKLLSRVQNTLKRLNRSKAKLPNVHEYAYPQKRDDLLDKSKQSPLDDGYTRKDHRIFDQGYVHPSKKYQFDETPYYDPSQKSLEKEQDINSVEGPIHVFDQSVLSDTKFDPNQGIPRPPHNWDDNYSRAINDKDPLPYYDPVGDHKNIIRPDDNDSLIYAVPINYQDTLDVDNHLEEIAEQKRLIRKPWVYYDPTVKERVLVDPLQQALDDDAVRRAEPPAKMLDQHQKEEALKEAAVQKTLGNAAPVYVAGWPDYKQLKVESIAHTRREDERTGKWDQIRNKVGLPKIPLEQIRRRK